MRFFIWMRYLNIHSDVSVGFRTVDIIKMLFLAVNAFTFCSEGYLDFIGYHGLLFVLLSHVICFASPPIREAG